MEGSEDYIMRGLRVSKTIYKQLKIKFISYDYLNYLMVSPTIS